MIMLAAMVMAPKMQLAAVLRLVVVVDDEESIRVKMKMKQKMHIQTRSS